MKIVLAYEVEGLGSPDETVVVDPAMGRRLIREGNARPVISQPVSAPKTVKEAK